MPKLDETLCEVCHKPVDVLHEYQAQLGKVAYQPREWFEKQLNMTDEEKALRKEMIEEILRRHTEMRAKGEVGLVSVHG